MAEIEKEEPLTFVFEADVTERKRFIVEADSADEAEELIKHVEAGYIGSDNYVEIEDGWDVFVIDWRTLRCTQDPTAEEDE